MSAIESALTDALTLQRRGELAAAESAYRDLLQRFGPNPDAEHMLGLALHAQGRSEESLAWFERASAARGDAMLWSNHAAALLAVGRAADAAVLARRATQADPRHIGAWLNLGLASEIQNAPGEAIAAFETVLRIAPGQTVARRALARCRVHIGEFNAALAVLAAFPAGSDPAADLLRCEAWIGLGEIAMAAEWLDRLTSADPTNKAALLLQAKIASERSDSAAALDLLERVLRIDPDNRQATVRTALIRINRLDLETGLSQLRDWLDRHPEDQSTASNYLIACNYSERFDAAALLAEYCSLRPAVPPVESWPGNWRAPPSGAKLRIGWASSAFSVGPMEIFFADVLRAFAEVAPDIEHVLYAVGGESTSAPASASWAAHARDVSAMSDRRLVELIRADGIDVLVDMIGRAAGNRLPVFAARAAPVQVGWLDAFYSSGVDSMDYLITDPWLSPPGADGYFSEKLLHLPHGRLAYRPPPADPVRSDGADSKRFVSLNRFSKINDAVIAVWATILRELPDWTLLLKAMGGDDATLADILRARFKGHGIAEKRIEIAGSGPYAEAMEAYQGTAIALDPFPFSGCSTSCDALWMGLPVITWPRDTIASRQTAALLQSAGRSDWIARDAESYVASAVRIARDVTARHEWRLRSRDIVCPAFCDARRCAQELLVALRGAALPRA